jgi:hypothetical protein
MFKSMFIEFFYDLVLQNLDIHNASGARDGPPRPRPLKMGERFVPGFKRRRVVISRLLLSTNFKVFSRSFNGGVEWKMESFM